MAFGAAGLLSPPCGFRLLLKDCGRGRQVTVPSPRLAAREPPVFFLNPTALLVTAVSPAACASTHVHTWARMLSERYGVEGVPQPPRDALTCLIRLRASSFGRGHRRFVRRFPRSGFGLQICAARARGSGRYLFGRAGTFSPALRLTSPTTLPRLSSQHARDGLRRRASAHRGPSSASSVLADGSRPLISGELMVGSESCGDRASGMPCVMGASTSRPAPEMSSPSSSRSAQSHLGMNGPRFSRGSGRIEYADTDQFSGATAHAAK